jgi:hypothetical protein
MKGKSMEMEKNVPCTVQVCVRAKNIEKAV